MAILDPANLTIDGSNNTAWRLAAQRQTQTSQIASQLALRVGRTGAQARNPFWAKEIAISQALKALVPGLSELDCEELKARFAKLQKSIYDGFAAQAAAQCVTWEALLNEAEFQYLHSLETHCGGKLENMLMSLCVGKSYGACLYDVLTYVTGYSQPAQPFIVAIQSSCLGSKLWADLAAAPSTALLDLLKSIRAKLEPCAWAENPSFFFSALSPAQILQVMGLEGISGIAIDNGTPIGLAWLQLNQVYALMILRDCPGWNSLWIQPISPKGLSKGAACGFAIAQLGGGWTAPATTGLKKAIAGFGSLTWGYCGA